MKLQGGVGLEQPARSPSLSDLVFAPYRLHDVAGLANAEPGERAVIIPGCRSGEDPPIDDGLERLPALEVIVACGPLALHRAHPRIAALLCTGAIDERTLRGLPGLRAARFDAAGDTSIDPTWITPTLAHLRGRDRAFTEPLALRHFPGLETLSLDVDDAGSLQALPGLPRLRRLRLEGQPLRAGSLLRGLVEMQEADYFSALATNEADILIVAALLLELARTEPVSG